MEEPARTTRTTVDNLLMEFQRLNSAATATQAQGPPEHSSQTPRPGMITCCSPWLRIFSSKVGYRQNHLGFRAALVGERCVCVSYYHWVQGLRWWTRGQAITVMLVLLLLYKTSTRGSITSEDSARVRLDECFGMSLGCTFRIWHSVCLSLPPMGLHVELHLSSFYSPTITCAH